MLAFALQLTSLNESAIQQCACQGMQMEVVTKSGARVDCLDDEYATEIEATSGWAQSIGQSLHYASETGKRARVLFFCEDEEAVCYRHVLRFESTVEAWGLPIEWGYVPEQCKARRTNPTGL